MHPDDDRLQRAFEVLPEGHRPRALDEAVLARAAQLRVRRPLAPWLASAACAALAAWMIWPMWRPAIDPPPAETTLARTEQAAAPEPLASAVPLAAHQGGGGGEPAGTAPSPLALPFAAEAGERAAGAAPRTGRATQTLAAAPATVAVDNPPKALRAKSAPMPTASAAATPEPGTAAAWWQEIEALLAAHAPHAAQAALAALRRQHPDFEQPAPFPEALDWQAAAPDE